MKSSKKDFQAHHKVPQGYFERMEDALHLKLKSEAIEQKAVFYKPSFALALALPIVLAFAYILWPSAAEITEPSELKIEDYLLAEMSSDELMELYASDFELPESDGIEAYLLEEDIDINELVNN